VVVVVLLVVVGPAFTGTFLTLTNVLKTTNYVSEENCFLLRAKPLALKHNYVDVCVCVTFLVSFVLEFVVSPEQGSSVILKHRVLLRVSS
jgi:hypothetical protein